MMCCLFGSKIYPAFNGPVKNLFPQTQMCTVEDYSGRSREVSESKPPLRFQETSRNSSAGCIEVKYLEGSATPLFYS